MKYRLKFLERERICKDVYFYIVETIPKHNAQDMDNCIGKYICRAPDREGGGGCREKKNDEP